jgi:hypothetical protein
MSDTGATGQGYYVKFGSTVLSTNYRMFNTSEEMGVVDQSAGADTARTYLTTLEDGTASLTAKYKAGDTAIWGAIDKGTEATLEWGEEGTAAGKPKHTVNAIVTNRSKDAQYDDLIVVSAQFQFSGAVTDDTY